MRAMFFSPCFERRSFIVTSLAWGAMGGFFSKPVALGMYVRGCSQKR